MCGVEKKGLEVCDDEKEECVAHNPCADWPDRRVCRYRGRKQSTKTAKLVFTLRKEHYRSVYY